MTDWAAIKGNTEEKIKRWSKKSGSAGGVGGGGQYMKCIGKGSGAATWLHTVAYNPSSVAECCP